jgi:hypothetical protein
VVAGARCVALRGCTRRCFAVSARELTPVACPRAPNTQVEDLNGNALYERLGVTRRASAAAVRAAFRAAARVHHPDKGGDARTFAQLRHAFEVRPARNATCADACSQRTRYARAHHAHFTPLQVLSDPKARATYDEWASQVKYRCAWRTYRRARSALSACGAAGLCRV